MSNDIRVLATRITLDSTTVDNNLFGLYFSGSVTSFAYLQSSAFIGSTSLSLVNSGSHIFHVGDVIILDFGMGSQETCIVATVPTLSSLTITAGLIKNHYTSSSAIIYTATGNNVFQWAENPIPGLSTWLSGMIAEKGISSWKRSINLLKGGNISDPGGFTVTVKNADQFNQMLTTAGISLTGLRVELIEFINGTENIRAVGKINSITWDIETVTIDVQGCYNDRDANLTIQTLPVAATANTPAVSAMTYPVLFGSGLKAKAIQTQIPVKLRSSDFPVSDAFFPSDELNNTQFICTGYIHSDPLLGMPLLTIQFS